MFKTREENLKDFEKARYGLFIHYGLYSLLERGEWVINKEKMDVGEYMRLADKFTAEKFDADRICAMAKAAGMRYICLTSMHHEGFMLYDSKVSDFCTTKTACGRDLVAEMISAARKHGLRVHLYHSLDHLTCSPDAVDALENEGDYEKFISFTFERIKELVTKYNPIDVLWYDGWWPFNAEKWHGEEMNRMISEIQPWLLFNGRNGLAGDFGTPEGHMSAPSPWRPWEACMTLNENWGYTRGDDDWKPPRQVIAMLLTAAKGNGNLLLNVGPEPDGAIPAPAEKILREVGKWLEKNGEAVYDTEVFDMHLMERGTHRSDWSHVCDYTASGNNLYLTMKFPTYGRLRIAGFLVKPLRVTLLASGKECQFSYEEKDGKLVIEDPAWDPSELRPVFKVECSGRPEIYGCGGMRTPKVPHPPYDPCQSDLMA